MATIATTKTTARSAALLEFEKLTETLLEWGDEIFAFHHTDRATNGRIEGTNDKLGVLQRVQHPEFRRQSTPPHSRRGNITMNRASRGHPQLTAQIQVMEPPRTPGTVHGFVLSSV